MPVIKGTTRRVIEVNGSDSCYFEKAVLYVRPECSPIEDSSLAREAKIYAAKLSEYADSGKKQRSKTIAGVLIKTAIVLISIAAAAGVYVLVHF